MSNNYLSAPWGRQPKSGNASMVHLHWSGTRNERNQTPDWVLDFRDSSDDENKPLMLSNQVHINVDDVLPLCAKVSAPHQNTLTSEKWSLRTNMQQFHHEVHVHQNKPAHSRSSAAAAVKQLLLLKRQHPPFLNFFSLSATVDAACILQSPL